MFFYDIKYVFWDESCGHENLTELKRFKVNVLYYIAIITVGRVHPRVRPCIVTKNIILFNNLRNILFFFFFSILSNNYHKHSFKCSKIVLKINNML